MRTLRSFLPILAEIRELFDAHRALRKNCFDFKFTTHGCTKERSVLTYISVRFSILETDA
jgi:hypothetical protein